MARWWLSLSVLASPMASRPSPWLLRRLGACVYDAFIIVALAMGTGALCLALTRGQMDVADPPWWYRLLLLAVMVAYIVLSWCRGGQTIGMRAWRLRLRSADGGPLGPGRALLRLGCATLSLVVLAAGFWWALVDADGLTWHDRLCRTRMQRLPARGRGA